MIQDIIILCVERMWMTKDHLPPLNELSLVLRHDKYKKCIDLVSWNPKTQKPFSFSIQSTFHVELSVELFHKTKQKILLSASTKIEEKCQITKEVSLGPDMRILLRSQISQRDMSTPNTPKSSPSQKQLQQSSNNSSSDPVKQQTARMKYALSFLSGVSEVFKSRANSKAFPVHQFKSWDALFHSMETVSQTCQQVDGINAWVLETARFYKALSLAQNGWLLDAQEYLDRLKRERDTLPFGPNFFLVTLLQGVMFARRNETLKAVECFNSYNVEVKQNNFSHKLGMERELTKFWLRKIGKTQESVALPRRVEQACAIKLSNKSQNGSNLSPMEQLQSMIGLRSVKESVQELVDTILVEKKMHEKKPSFKPQARSNNFIFRGNPGTGKTTVARRVASIFSHIGVIQKDVLAEIKGFELASKTGDEQKKFTEDNRGGVIFIDEAYQLEPQQNPGGKEALNLLLKCAEEWTDTIFILAGYDDDMDTLLCYNQGMKGRFQHDIKFHDYSKTELREILAFILANEDHAVESEKSLDVLIHRYAQGIGTKNFSNARGVRTLVERAIKKKNTRIAKLQASKVPLSERDYFTLSKEDILGDSIDISNCKALQELDSMIGLDSVKKSFHSIVDMVMRNRKLELGGVKSHPIPLHRAFYGNPGTGKTTVARLYAQLLHEMGLVIKDDVVEKDPSKFIGSVIGGSEKATNQIFAQAEGKVLFIDEAYGLNDKSGYAEKVVDTIVSTIHGKASDPCVVLMAGYMDEMLTFFREANPGLARRMQLEQAFHFEDYTDEELLMILNTTLRKKDICMKRSEAEQVIEICISKLRSKPKFGNAGEVYNAVSAADQRAPIRLVHSIGMREYLAQDFMPKSEKKKTVDEKLSEMHGMKGIKDFLLGLQSIAKQAADDGVQPHSLLKKSMNLRFEGPPGTGKTTCARLMGQVMQEYGALPTDRVVEVSASDLQTGYVGQAGKRTREIFESALGGVLFIDEAYRLIPSHNSFNQDIMDEICNILSETKFVGNVAVVFAGYEDDMEQLMRSNSGLESRFSEKIFFSPMNADEASAMFISLAETEEYPMSQTAQRDLPSQMDSLITSLQTHNASWSSGRDVKKLFIRALRSRALRLQREPVSDSKKKLRSGRMPFESEDMVAACDFLLKERCRVPSEKQRVPPFHTPNVQRPKFAADHQHAQQKNIVQEKHKEYEEAEDSTPPKDSTAREEEPVDEAKFEKDFQEACILNKINIDTILNDIGSEDNLPDSVVKQFAAAQGRSSANVRAILRRKWKEMTERFRRMVEERKRYEERLRKEEEERQRLAEQKRQLEIQRQKERDEQRKREMEEEAQRLLEEARAKKPCFYCGRPWDCCPYEVERRSRGIFIP